MTTDGPWTTEPTRMLAEALDALTARDQQVDDLLADCQVFIDGIRRLRNLLDQAQATINALHVEVARLVAT